MAPLFHFHCYGLRFASELHFPEMIQSVASTEEVDVTIRMGETPSSLPGARRMEPFDHCWEGRANEFLLTVGLHLRFHVVEGNSITIQATPDAHSDALRLFLFGSAFGALLHQRGYLPLHGSSVRMPDGRAAVFLGHSGSGKSTLAALLGRRGHPPLGDDTSPLRVDEGGALCLYPGLPQHKLWLKTLEQLEHDPSDGHRVLPTMDKYYLPAFSPALTPAPLGKLYILEPGDVGSVTMEPLVGKERLAALFDHTYRSDFARRLGQNPGYLRLVAAVAGSGVTIRRLRRPCEGWSLSECVELMEADWGAPFR